MAKTGTKENPVVIRVQTQERATELLSLSESRGWKVIIGIESDKTEDISDIERLLNPPEPVKNDITLGRNDSCSCGSGKKYKHCCLN
ncbi:MAG: PBPRA1643 family SWIM/SEC-C metal-binding motif protein [Bacteroidia bacterium]